MKVTMYSRVRGLKNISNTKSADYTGVKWGRHDGCRCRLCKGPQCFQCPGSVLCMNGPGENDVFRVYTNRGRVQFITLHSLPDYFKGCGCCIIEQGICAIAIFVNPRVPGFTVIVSPVRCRIVAVQIADIIKMPAWDNQCVAGV